MPVAEPFELVGREDELGRVRELAGALGDGPHSLAIHGEAGIGKTVLWRAAIEAAEDAGITVLMTRCAQAEMPLALGGLGDLLDSGLPVVAEELAEPQRRALAVAVGFEAPSEETPDRLALPRAFLAYLRALADRSAVLLAIDDIQWLDPSSQRILAFAARRLGDAPVGILSTQRGGAADPLDLRRSFDERSGEIDVGPLRVGALHHLIRTRLGVRIPRPMVARVHEASGGNPMFALEFAQVAASAGTPLAVPASLEELVAARAARLPHRVLPLLEAVAAAERPTPAVLARAVDDGELLLDAAIAEGAVTLGRESVVRFAHPLLASAVYGAIPAARRRVVHARLAEASRGAEERARHLALAALEPDVEVARLLDEAARHAQARGAPDAAAELAHQAFRLTPDFDVEGRANRMLAVAVSVFHSGDVAAAAAVLDEQHPADASGPKRAETLLLRYLVEQDAALVSRFAAEALEHVRDDDPLRIRILILLSSLAVHFDDPETSTALARRALADAEKIAEPALLALALAGVAKREAAAGGGDPALAERAFTLAAEHGWMQGALSTRVVLAGQRLLDGDLGGARNLLEVELDETFRSGREDARWPILSALVPLELQAGNWDTAERHFDAAQDLVIDGDHWGDSITVSQGGLIAALRGRVDDARRFASEGIRYGESAHARSLVTMNRAVLGFLEHSLGDSGSAWQVLSDPPAAVDRWLPAYPGFPEPMPEAVEALVALGRLEEADAILAKFATRWPDHRWAVPAELRCRALLLLACRQAEAALDAAEEAVVASEAVGFPLDRGRALLVAGETLRRLGERRRAAEKLEAAKGVFSELGAPLWFARAENELRRASPRPRRDRELTSAERRVAALVASGRTNREVAAQLFTTVGTVEAHLTRIYRKLGLRSRTELARRVADAKLDLDTE